MKRRSKSFLLASFVIASITAIAGLAGPTLLEDSPDLSATATTPSSSVLVDAGLAVVDADGLVTVDPTTTAALLNTLVIDDDDSATASYDRSRFGQRWKDVDRNGCDQRNDILGRDLLEVTYKPGTRDCKVIAGTFVSAYTGETLTLDAATLAKDVHIDHVLPLSLAWRRGADAWTDDQRTLFANDPDNLQASDSTSNQAKSDSGPGEWLPSSMEYRCEYVTRFTHVNAKYSLTISTSDRNIIAGVLASCR